MSEQVAPTLESLLHEMWGDARGGSTYNKTKWVKLQALIAAERAAREKSDTFREELRAKYHQLVDEKNELLAEVERLRKELAAMTRSRDDYAKGYTDQNSLHSEAAFEADKQFRRAQSAEAQLQIAREALGAALEIISDYSRPDGTSDPDAEEVKDKIRAALAQITVAHQNSPTTDDAVLAVMKKCQRGFPPHMIDESNSLHAECYGTIGALRHELNELRAFKAGALKLTTEASIECVNKSDELRRIENQQHHLKP